MQLQRVLFVAPADSGLDVAPEMEALYTSGFAVQIVAQPITRQRLFDTIRRQQFDILHFACHADDAGLTLSHGERLDVAGLVQFARSCKAVLVFLNACETAEIGQILYDEDIPATICTLRKVDDVQAKETAQCFYRELAELNDVRKAYNRSKPPVKGGYSLFANGKLHELQFAPIIEKLEQFATIVECNQQEHADFRHGIHTLTGDMDALKATFYQLEHLRPWLLRVFGMFVVLSTLVQLIVTLIARTP